MFLPFPSHVFEKQLILKQLSTTGQCPLTGEPLNLETDLIELQVAKSVQPKPVGANSFPGMLKCLQDEWNVQMLENYELKSQNEKLR